MKKRVQTSKEDEREDLITQTEAARIRGVTRAAIADLVKRGRLRSVEMFGRTLVYRSEVEAFKVVHAGWPKGKSRKQAKSAGAKK